MSTEAAGAERHAAPAWQSWGVISVCRLEEGVTEAWPRETVSLSAGARNLSLSIQHWEEKPEGSPNRKLSVSWGRQVTQRGRRPALPRGEEPGQVLTKS